MRKVFQIPGDMLGRLKDIPKTEWGKFFDELEIEYALKIKGCKNEIELLKLQAKVEAFRELEQTLYAEFKRE